MLRPARIEQHRPRQRNEIRLSAGDDGFGLLRVGDHADSTGGDAGFFLYTFGERQLVTGANGDFGVEHHATAGHRDIGTAIGLQCPRISHRLIGRKAAIDKIGAGYFCADKPLCWKRRTNRAKDLQREAHAVVETAAIFIITLVRQR